MKSVELSLNQLIDLFFFTPLSIRVNIEKLKENQADSTVLYEDGTIIVHYENHIERYGGCGSKPAWGIKSRVDFDHLCRVICRQDFDHLCRIIDAEFGIDGMCLNQIYTGLNTLIQTIGDTERYCEYYWSDDDRRIDGTEYVPFYENASLRGKWDWNEDTYKFHFKVDGGEADADYRGTSPREAWEALVKKLGGATPAEKGK